MPESFHTMSTYTVTCTIHDNMEDEEVGEEAGARGSDRQRLRSG